MDTPSFLRWWKMKKQKGMSHREFKSAGVFFWALAHALCVCIQAQHKEKSSAREIFASTQLATQYEFSALSAAPMVLSHHNPTRITTTILNNPFLPPLLSQPTSSLIIVITILHTCHQVRVLCPLSCTHGPQPISTTTTMIITTYQILTIEIIYFTPPSQL